MTPTFLLISSLPKVGQISCSLDGIVLFHPPCFYKCLFSACTKCSLTFFWLFKSFFTAVKHSVPMLHLGINRSPIHIFICQAFVIEHYAKFHTSLKPLIFRNNVLFESPIATATQKLVTKFWISECVHEGIVWNLSMQNFHLILIHDLTLVWPRFDLKDTWSFNQYSGKADFEETRIFLTVSVH